MTHNELVAVLTNHASNRWAGELSKRLIDARVWEYVDEAEHQESEEYWENFGTAEEVTGLIEDFDMYWDNAEE